MNWIELLGFVTGLASVLLFATQKTWAWPIGLVNSASWLVLFLQSGLYADSGLQVVYIGLGVYGWWSWHRGTSSRGALPVTSASTRARLLLAAAAIVATGLLTVVLDRITDSTVPLPDAATTVLSLTATYLLARKHIDNWPIWILGVNIPYIALYIYKGLLLTAALQPLFIALSIGGWIAWHRAMDRSSGAAAPA